MPRVLQFMRRLSEPPVLPVVPCVTLRTYAGSTDIAHWLRIHESAFAGETPRTRVWNDADFAREFLSQPWWTADRMWFAEVEQGAGPPLNVGTVTLAMRPSAHAARVAVHWLAVCPAWRRRGIARLLLAQCERACWDAGHSAAGHCAIHAETHSGWEAAVRLYESKGYVLTGGGNHTES